MKYFVSVVAFMILLFFSGCSTSENYVRYSTPVEWHSTEHKPNIRIKIYSGKAIPIYTNGRYTFTSEQYEITNGKNKFVPHQAGSFVSNNKSFQLNGKTYHGQLYIVRQKNIFIYVNHVPLDEYLISVVGHEMPPNWHISALKAQAVLARTYLLHRVSAHKPYDVVSSTAHQVYGGQVKNDAKVRLAVQQTNNQVLTFNFELAEVFYHSNSGGQTAASSEVWRMSRPYLISKESPYAQESPVYRWLYNIPLSSLAKKLRVQNIRKVAVSKRSESHRAATVKYLSEQGWQEISAKRFRSLLGNTKVRSTLFDVRINGNQLEIGGKGYGHGVGMGQWDANVMAEKHGYSYRSILYFFFPGTKIKNLQIENKKTPHQLSQVICTPCLSTKG